MLFKNSRVKIRPQSLLIIPILFAILTFILLIKEIPGYAIDNSLYITRRGSFLISHKEDPYIGKHVRINYVPIGTVVFIDGEAFTIPNEKENFRNEKYIPIITESGIRGCVLWDCLFKPANEKLIVPQHIIKELDIMPIDESGTRIDFFSRSDGKFAKVTGYDENGYLVLFPFKYSETFNEHCGTCLKKDEQQTVGYVRHIEIDREGAKIIDPNSYKKSEIVFFKPYFFKTKEIVDAILKCTNGKIFPKLDSKITEKLDKHASKFFSFLTSCGAAAAGDVALRGELFGFGGGISFSYEFKPKNRRLFFQLYDIVKEGKQRGDRILVIKRFECREGKAIMVKRLDIVNLSNLKSYNLLEDEIKRRTNLVHIPSGDEESRQVMVTIREEEGHGDIFRLYKFILDSKDFRSFVTVEKAKFTYNDKHVRTYLDFIIKQIADFRRLE